MNKAVQICLGIVFLSAALFRTCYYPAAILEIRNLGLPDSAAILVILIELVLAACFLFSRFVKQAAVAAVLFLTVPICISVVLYPEVLYSQLSNLFVFDATATDVFLHVLFLVMAILIFAAERNKRGGKSP